MKAALLFQLAPSALIIGRAPANPQATPSTNHPAWEIAAGQTLAFEAATIKPTPSDDPPRVNFTLGPGATYAETGGRFETSNISLLDYIRFAYKLTDGQVVIMRAHAPNWIETERFDIQARSQAPHPTKDQMRLMVQSLLAERFHLTTHTETQELPVLAIVLAKPGKLGPQLRPHPPGDSACPTIATPANQTSPIVCGGLTSVGVPSAPSHIRIGGQAVPLSLLAAHLGEMGHYDRPIVDQTGLDGTFDLTLEWGPDAAPASPDAAVQDEGPALLQRALADQLGLKLERTRTASTMLLIDYIDRQPTAN